MMVLCDMRKFSSQSRDVNIDLTTCSHQWLLLSFVQIILSGDRLQQVTHINTITNIHPSIARLLTNACLRLLASFNLLVTLHFLLSRSARHTRAATNHSSIAMELYLYLCFRVVTRQSYPYTCMLKPHTNSNTNKYLHVNLFLCVRQAIEPSSSCLECLHMCRQG